MKNSEDLCSNRCLSLLSPINAKHRKPQLLSIVNKQTQMLKLEESMTLIMALDQGTTSSRTVLVNARGNCWTIQRPLDCHYPQTGWVEQDPLQIWETQRMTMLDVMQRRMLASKTLWLGITNQRETTVVWEKATGKPLAPAIVWQCRRSTAICEQLKANRKESLIRKKTGLVLDPYFSASKMLLLNEVPGLNERMKAGEICFGTVDSWLIWNMTAGNVLKQM